MICKICGHTLAENQRICIACGCKIDKNIQLTLKWPIENNKISRRLKVYITVWGENYKVEHLMKHGSEINITIPCGDYSLVYVYNTCAFSVNASLYEDATYQIFTKSIWSKIELTKI